MTPPPTSPTTTSRRLAGPVGFVALTLALTWGSAAALADAWPGDGPVATRLLRASLVYAAVVGWQPLVALLVVRRAVDRAWLDRGAYAMSSRYMTHAIGLPIVLLGGAAIVDAVLGSTGAGARGASIDAGWADAVLALSAFVVVIAVLWIQAIVEEVAWRGYLLARLMQSAGAWPGLFLHGVLWGVCYAPVVAVGDPAGDPVRIACVVVTCGLLGVLLGWLRLASRSIAASATCNATLTICAGLPLVLQGVTPVLGAVFAPPGWLVMIFVIAWIASRRSLRAAVATPQRSLPDHVN